MSEPTPLSESPGTTMPPTPASATAAAPTPRLVTVNSVNWGNILDFTHLFKGFRLAINPAKLTIALLAIMMIYASGRLFDAVWGPQADRNAIGQFAQNPSAGRRWQADRE